MRVNACGQYRPQRRTVKVKEQRADAGDVADGAACSVSVVDHPENAGAGCVQTFQACRAVAKITVHYARQRG